MKQFPAYHRLIKPVVDALRQLGGSGSSGNFSAIPAAVMVCGLKPTAIIVAVATRQSGPFPNDPLGPLALPSGATAFGVRGLDPAFTFGGSRIARRTMVKRVATNARPACDDLSPLDANPEESRSGVKPPHSKASRHSHDDLENAQRDERRWAIVVSGFSRRDVRNRNRMDLHTPRLSTKRSRLASTTMCRLKPLTTFAFSRITRTAVAQATSPVAVLTGDSPDCAALRRNVGRVARQDSCRRVACATTQHRSDLANA